MLIPPQVAIGGRLATVVWFGNALDGSGMSEVPSTEYRPAFQRARACRCA